MTRARSLLALFPAALLAAGCSKGSSGSGSGASGTAGIAVPTEISALPTGSETAHGLAYLGQALSATSDYATARTFKYVDERALSQFNILNTIFKAIGQTHYDDAANVGQEPYGAMVTWEEEKGDSNSKSIVNWVVQSDMVGGENVLKVWMMMPMGDDGSLHLIKVKMTISQAPTQNADGSYTDYGIWRIDAKMDNGGFFAAEASRDDAGLSVIAIRDAADRPDKQTLGVLHKSASTGYGKVSFPNWNDPQCMNGGCDGSTPPPSLVVAYRYDADAVALKKGGADPIYKDRTQFVDFVQRYGLYDADGNDVTRSHSFGFPLRFTDGTGYAYYGAWQGRHQVWGNGQPVAAGTTVTRQTWGSGAATETYTVSPVFTGILVERTLVPAAIADIQDIVLRANVNRNAEITYHSAGDVWTACYDPQGNGSGTQTCGGGTDDSFDVSELQSHPELDENVWINMCEQMGGCFNLVYQDGTFYKAAQSNNGPPQANMSDPWTPVDGARLWTNKNSPAFIYWNGSAWMKKEVVSLDQYHNPVFADEIHDTAFSFPVNQEQYLNDMGTNYVIKTTDGASYSVKVEQQKVANPDNASDFAGLVFRQHNGSDTESTFSFDAAQLKLVYKVPGSGSGHVAGDPLESNVWDLQASHEDGTPVAERYNYEYPQGSSNPGDNYGKQQFLIDGQDQYVFLDDPIRLAPIELTGQAGTTKKYALSFDGNWVQGLPSIWEDLHDANGDMSAAIAAKVANIPDGQVVTDATDSSKTYLFKQLQVTEYLLPLDTTPTDLDLAQASALDLAALAPTPIDPGLGAMPDVQVKYSEGNAVE